MCKIPTLYSDYQECILDLDIYGKIVATPQQSIDDLTQVLFEEFKRRKPFPTLEYKRYELSRLVNPDYRIAYNKELELQDNESLVELRNMQSSFESIDFEDLTPLIPEVQEAFSYEMNITDSLRQSIIEKYNLDTGEEFKPGIKQTEDIVGTIEEDSDLLLSDEEVENLGVINEDLELDTTEDNNIEIDEDYVSYDSQPEVDDDYIDYESSNNEFEDYEEDADDLDDYSSYEDDDSDDYSSYEGKSDNDEEEQSEDIDDLSDYDNYEDEDSDDFSDYDNYEDEDSDDFSDCDNYEDEDENGTEDDYSDYSDDVKESIYESEDVNDSEEVESSFVDSVLDEPEPVIFEEPIVQKHVEIPVTPAQVHNDIPVGEVIDRSAEPTDIRAFLRKHPRCDYEFALKYFTKKQINDAIKIGKIVKKGNILKI